MQSVPSTYIAKNKLLVAKYLCANEEVTVQITKSAKQQWWKETTPTSRSHMGGKQKTGESLNMGATKTIGPGTRSRLTGGTHPVIIRVGETQQQIQQDRTRTSKITERNAKQSRDYDRL